MNVNQVVGNLVGLITNASNAAQAVIDTIQTVANSGVALTSESQEVVNASLEELQEKTEKLYELVQAQLRGTAPPEG